MLFAASIFILPLCATASNFNIYHRIFSPGAPEFPFVQRGVTDDSHFQPSSSLSQQWLDFENVLEGLLSTPEVDLGRVLYQVALESEGADRDISSVKLCHIPLITSESIILHTPHSAQINTPYAIDYFVAPIPDDGTCPRLSSGPAALPSPFHALSKLNTTIIHRPATLPPLPQLRTPPQLTAEGAPVQPPPEKSFVQKYWMYIVAVLFALMMTSGGAEEEGQSRAGR
ncbi:hypothetical protein J3R30DRAFT_3702996 [Lentinula aciculospora]|uniref:ER membrane protein complex subunit 10 n=1 Tax=Lentinula aciculospora TaxID=153920 RepID=A0A9W9ABL4_9AGAR|nr:hypothetical protein J3R30DRAFT_3702996 [Lentinula aciculospora]